MNGHYMDELRKERAVKAELLAELKNLCQKVARLEGIEIPYPVAIPIGLALAAAEFAIAKAEGRS